MPPGGNTTLEPALDEPFTGTADGYDIDMFVLGKFDQFLCRLTIFDYHLQGDIMLGSAFFDNINHAAAQVIPLFVSVTGADGTKSV